MPKLREIGSHYNGSRKRIDYILLQPVWGRNVIAYLVGYCV